jgi:hypothetical protein
VSGGSGTTRFVYDGDRLVAEYNSSGAILHRYVHGPGVDEPVVWYEGAGVGTGSRRYLHTDHQGSGVAIADAAGSIEGGWVWSLTQSGPSLRVSSVGFFRCGSSGGGLLMCRWHTRQKRQMS